MLFELQLLITSCWSLSPLLQVKFNGSTAHINYPALQLILLINFNRITLIVPVIVCGKICETFNKGYSYMHTENQIVVGRRQILDNHMKLLTRECDYSCLIESSDVGRRDS